MAALGKITGIVAWVLVAVLAIALVLVFMQGQQRARQGAALGEALSEVATAAGVEELEPGALATGEGREDVVGQIQESIRNLRVQATSAVEERDAAQRDAASARSEAQSTSGKVQELESRVESLSRELSSGREEWDAARTELEQAAKQAEESLREAERARSRVERKLERVESERAEETARLEAEMAALLAPDSMVEEDGELEDVEDEPVIAPVEDDVEFRDGRAIGMSRMFSHVRQDRDGTLRFRLLDGQVLTYHDVPPSIVRQLVNTTDRIDVIYRFRIQGEFKSIPSDSAVVRKYWRWHRRHRPYSEVLFIEPPPAAAEPAEPAAQEEEEQEEE